MRHKNFGDFVDKKKRESIRQLKLIKQMLEHQGLKVENFLESEDEDDPYIFCTNPTKGGGFDGIRIYKIGDQLAFRIQKENKTHPYGSAYPLPIEEMFHDFLSDDEADEAAAGKRVIESVAKEVRRFFDKSLNAEREERETNQDKESSGNVLIRTTGTDYSAMVFSKA